MIHETCKHPRIILITIIYYARLHQKSFKVLKLKCAKLDFKQNNQITDTRTMIDQIYQSDIRTTFKRVKRAKLTRAAIYCLLK